MTKMSRTGRLRAGSAAAALSLAATPAAAQTPSLGLYGTSGLIDMPTALSQPDAQMSTTVGHFAGQTRTTLTFQALPRVSGSFRYSALDDFSDNFGTYYDRSFDISVQLLTEGRYRPAVAVGLRDLAGTGVYSSEYLVATKHLGPVAVTGGLGWGRLGSSGDIGTPFGERPARNIEEGGRFDIDQYFRGPAAPFFGLEWRPAENWALKLEYSSDAYAREVDRDLIDRDSDWNAGVEYSPADWLTLGAYSLYGSEVAVSAAMSFNLTERPTGSGVESAPLPIQPRPPRAAAPEAYATGWSTQPAAETALRARLDDALSEEGVRLEGLRLSAGEARLWIHNVRYGVEPQALGRTARVAARLLPASVERLVLVPVTGGGMAISEATFSRSALEATETAADGAALLREATRVGPATAMPGPEEQIADLYPSYDASLGPYVDLSYFDPAEPLRYELGLALNAEARPAPGWVFSGTVTKSITGTIDDADIDNDSALPPVRTDWPKYARQGDPTLTQLTAARYFRPGLDLYGRVTGGYLERMFGGLSGEILWKPADSRLGLGAEINYAVKRDYDGGFGFQDYDVLTGHASAYYDLGGGYQAQVDAGRYLAGDWGATVSLDREFSNGWRVGGFFTLTDVSAEEFGEGSFDKGIRVRIPLSWFTGQPSRGGPSFTVRPVTRDGGARLRVPGRLYNQVRDYHAPGLDPQWGRFWR